MTEPTKETQTETPKTAPVEETPTDETQAERKRRLPKLELHKLPGAETVGELLETQMANLKSLYEEWERVESENKGRIDHGIDEMARLAHVAVDMSLDFIGKMRSNTLQWLEQGANRFRHH